MTRPKKELPAGELTLDDLPGSVKNRLVADKRVVIRLEGDKVEIVGPLPSGPASDGSNADAHPALQLLDHLLAEDPAYDKETWPLLRKGLQENRKLAGERALFPDD